MIAEQRDGYEAQITALQQRVKELTCQKTALQQVVSERDEEIRRLKAIQREQEEVVVGFGIITCRNNVRHTAADFSGCIYCRITELEDLLRSAHAIAARQGADTHWARFAASIQKLGIGSITARVYKLDREDVC